MIFLALVGFLFIGLAIPLVMRKVPPNGWYGFRTPDTLADKELWYKANRYMGRDLVIYGIYWILCTEIVSRYEWEPPRGILVWAGLIYLGAMVIVIRGLLYVNRLKK